MLVDKMSHMIPKRTRMLAYQFTPEQILNWFVQKIILLVSLQEASLKDSFIIVVHIRSYLEISFSLDFISSQIQILPISVSWDILFSGFQFITCSPSFQSWVPLTSYKKGSHTFFGLRFLLAQRKKFVSILSISAHSLMFLPQFLVLDIS